MTLHSNKDLMTTYAATEKVKDICKAVSRQSLKITKWGVSNLTVERRHQQLVTAYIL